jgi:hypothetical protein
MSQLFPLPVLIHAGLELHISTPGWGVFARFVVDTIRRSRR